MSYACRYRRSGLCSYFCLYFTQQPQLQEVYERVLIDERVEELHSILVRPAAQHVGEPGSAMRDGIQLKDIHTILQPQADESQVHFNIMTPALNESNLHFPLLFICDACNLRAE